MKSLQTILFAIALIALLQINLSTASPTCQDSETFLWKQKEGKDCEWLKSKSPKRRDRICNHRWNKSARKECRKTCDSCGEVISEIKVRSKCPRKRNQKRYTQNGKPSHCLRFQPGLECGISTWTGCNTGDMACTISSSFTCDETSRRWLSDPTLSAELCEPTVEDKPYGKTCNPNTCPPFKPLEQGDCSWYNGSSTCMYDYRVTGCTKGSTSCTPTIEATCNPLTKVWDFDPIFSLCGTEASCDPTTYFDCPETEPNPGDSCQVYRGPQDCKYGHQIMGCTKDDLFCGYSSMGFCDPLEATWNTIATMPPKCDDRPAAVTSSTSTTSSTTTPNNDNKLPIGEPCDPSACPPSEPKDESYCGAWEGIKGKQICFYQYTMEGCSSDTLSCEPGVSYTCQIDTNQWIREQLYNKLECFTDDPLWGTECTPTDDGDDKEEPPPDSGEEAPRGIDGVCPVYQPVEGAGCEKSGLAEGAECPYQHTAIGCTPETLACSPVTTFSCVSGFWQQEIMGAEQCLDVPEDWPAGLACDPETFDASSYVDGAELEDPLKASCPEVEPMVGSDCTKTPLEGCIYDYTVAGCTPETLECLSVSTFHCDVIAKIWIEKVESRLDCAIPKGYPSGKCDPLQPIHIETPVQDGICPSTPPMQGTDCSKTGTIDGGCPFNFHVFGCSPDEASCFPIDQFYCEYSDDEQAWLWQQMSAQFAPCVHNYTPPGSCEGGIFVPVDEANEDDKANSNGICPSKEPTPGEDCSKTGHIVGGCPFDYQIFGCTPDDAECLPMSTFYCVHDDITDEWTWVHRMMSGEVCPNGTPSGSCDGTTLILD